MYIFSAKKFKKMREKHGLSRMDVAVSLTIMYKIRICPQTLYQWEAGRHTSGPTANILGALSSFYECKPNDFFEDKGDVTSG